MPLPDNFSHSKHLLTVVKRLQNRHVSRRFKDLGDATWNPDVGTPRAEERTACTVTNEDSLIIVLIRLFLFYFILGGFTEVFADFYTIPISTFHEWVQFEPQIILRFRETTADAKTHNRYPIRAQVGFRVKDKSISLTELERMARVIYQEFATPPEIFKKGRTKFAYRDKEKGYELIITAESETQVRELITKTLKIQNDIPDWENLSNSESGRNWGAKITKNILGKPTEMPTRRPVGNVKFTHAEYKQHGLTRDKILVDVTGKFRGALITGSTNG